MSKNKNPGVDREALYRQQQKDAAIKKHHKRQRQQAAQQEQEAFSRPAQRMRPESEVIARIKHSAPTMTANCTIGYMDRFKGLQTAPFELFFSGHEDYVDVPLHRIRHIKYYDRIIWDREARIDQVFQSTPASSHTLDYWLEHEDELREEQETRIQQEKARAAQMAAHEQSFVSAIRADIDRQRAELQPPSTSIPTEIRTRASKPTSTSTRKNPNHFISFRITNTDILSQLANVQHALLNHNVEYKSFLIPNGSFHLTLCLLCLTSQEEITRACNILTSLESSLRSMMRTPLSLPLTGCSSFGGRVIYVDTMTCDALALLQSYRDTLQRAFLAAGLHVCEAERHWTPHLTIAKMSRSRNHKIKKIEAAAYSSHVSHHFGMQPITHLELCSMMAKKRADGYYHVWKQIIVNNQVREYTIQVENKPEATATATDTTTETSITDKQDMECDTPTPTPTSSPPLLVSISATQSIATTVFGSPCIITHSPTDTVMSPSQDITSAQTITSTTTTIAATVIAPTSTPAIAPTPASASAAAASAAASTSTSATRRPRRVRHDE